jgi:bifunctional NMN adenylyltransferase/nudix hydrolase
MYKYKLAVVIGRFQPFHNGHEEIIRRALLQAEKVMILIGSVDKPRTYKNPWTYSERIDMIQGTLKESNRLVFAGLRDYPYNNRKWIYEVNHKIFCYMNENLSGDKVVLVGHDKDSTSWYLKKFPQYYSINCENYSKLNATDIRRYWLGTEVGEVRPLVPEGTFRIMESTGNELLYLTKEAEVIEQYKKSWSNSPFPPTLVCVDAVVFSAGQVLMVRRAQAPGKDLWALPGGFVDGRETLYEAVLRELLEETGLDLSKYKALVSKTFDHPDRGERGRTFTKAFKFEIPVDPILDKKTDGEASEIEWFPLNSINEMNTEIYQDHQNIIQYFNNNYNEVVDESHFGY